MPGAQTATAAGSRSRVRRRVLLSRTEFRQQVLARDQACCVVCAQPAADAHHLIERRLFNDGGYYLDNGVALCSEHHLAAEQTTLSVEELRRAAGIAQAVVPEHLEADQRYDKWGNLILGSGQRSPGELFHEPSVQQTLAAAGLLDMFTSYVKYPRTWHLPWSPGASDDDKVLTDVSQFEGQEVVVTRKEDGENTTIYRDYIHARSLDSRHHPSRTSVKALQGRIGHELPEGWRLCGENLQAQHSIAYHQLPEYFLLFAIYNADNVCLSWDETQEWAQLLELSTVAELYRGIWDAPAVTACQAASSPWSDQVEGYVVRTTAGFPYAAFRRHTAKWVRAGHVQDDGGHWMSKPVVANGLAARP
jgi:hypothetical protein